MHILFVYSSSSVDIQTDQIPWWLKNVTKPEEVPLLNYPNHVNWSISSLYNGNWSVPKDATCKNCTGILRLKRNNGERDVPLGKAYLSISDKTFTRSDYQNAFYNEYLNKSSTSIEPSTLDVSTDENTKFTGPWNNTRRVRLFLEIIDGSYDSDSNEMLIGIGYYFPETQRCVAKGIFSQLFRSPQFSLNDTELEALKQEVISTTGPFPPLTNISSFEQDAEENTTGKRPSIAKSECTFDIWFNLDYTTRPYISTYFYTPDTELVLKYRDYYTTITDDQGNVYNTSDPIEISDYYLREHPSTPRKLYILRPANGPEQVTVPQFQLHLFSKECAVNVTLTGSIYNEAYNIKVGLVFFTVLIILLLISLFVGAHQQFILTSEAQLSRVSALTIYILTISSFTHSITLISLSVVFIPLQYLFLMAGSIAFMESVITNIPICTAKFSSWYIRRRGYQNLFFLVLFLALIVILSAVPIIWGMFMPFWTNIFPILLVFSYWIIQFVFRIMKKSATGPILNTYIIFNTLPKVYTAAYLLGCPASFMDLGTQQVFLWVIIIYVAVFCFLLFLQNQLGYDLGLRKLCCRKKLANGYKSSNSIYKYQTRLVTVSMLSETNPDSASDLRGSVNGKNSILEYINTLEQPFLLAFEDNSTVSAHTEGGESKHIDSNNIVICTSDIVTEPSMWCLNPYHAHSAFYNPSVELKQLFSNKLCPWLLAMDLDSTPINLEMDTNCFYIGELHTISKLLLCSICLEYIYVPLIHNINTLLIFKESAKMFPIEYKAASAMTSIQRCGGHSILLDDTVTSNDSKDYELWITPCDHGFHKKCLLKWLEQNLTCPIDRRQIPEYIVE